MYYKCNTLSADHPNSPTNYTNLLHANTPPPINAQSAVFLAKKTILSKMPTTLAKPVGLLAYTIIWRIYGARPRRWASLSPVALSDYLHANHTLLFLDDAHRLTGRKLQIARQCVLGGLQMLGTGKNASRADYP